MRPQLREEPTGTANSLPDSSKPKEAAPVPSGEPAPASTTQPSLNWESVQEEVAAAFPNIAPFLEAGRFVGMEGGLVTIGFAKQATVARAMLEKEDNLKTLAKLCERQSGHPIRLRIVELTDTESAGPTMAQQRAAKEQDQRLVLLERARANPVVKQALEIFGAELTEVRTVPPQEAE